MKLRLSMLHALQDHFEEHCEPPFHLLFVYIEPSTISVQLNYCNRCNKK